MTQSAGNAAGRIGPQMGLASVLALIFIISLCCSAFAQCPASGQWASFAIELASFGFLPLLAMELALNRPG